jgi:hypothetical protein
MEKYNIEGVHFQVSDREVFTKDMQPVYVEIRGQVFRPSLSSEFSSGKEGALFTFSKDEIAKKYINYRPLYIDNEMLMTQMDGFSRQAMKVCVGQNDLRGNAVAEGRDILRNCIETELEDLAREIGLYVNNVVVTDVQASEQAMAVINETNQYLLDASKAKAQAQKLEEEGKANAVQKEAEIRVQQAAAQETARQLVTLAKLEEEQLVAKRAVLEAEKENAILEQSLNKERALAAQELAKADLAQTELLASIYQSNPSYFQYLIAQLNASAIRETDKVMIIPEGTIPQIVLGKDVVPTLPIETPYSRNCLAKREAVFLYICRLAGATMRTFFCARVAHRMSIRNSAMLYNVLPFFRPLDELATLGLSARIVAATFHHLRRTQYAPEQLRSSFQRFSAGYNFQA